MEYDLVVIGGGPGGYVAAIRAAQYGMNVALIEKNILGGTCLNVGCIPTKAILEAVSIVDEIEKRQGITIDVKDYKLNYNKILSEKNKIVRQLVKGVESLLINNGVKVFKGIGRLIDKQTVEIKDENKTQKITSLNIILATGSQPIELSKFSFTNEQIINSTEALNLNKVPNDLLIIGGGVIGVEFANIFNNLGSNVTILEMEDQLIPYEDVEVSSALYNRFTSKGISIYTKVKAQRWEKKDEKIIIGFTSVTGEETIEVDKTLVSVGRKPVLEELGLENIRIKYDEKGVKVNHYLQTNIDNIYAVGDLIDNYKFAHVAFQEGIVAVENILGANKKVNYKAVPRCVYTRPEIAGVGLTEKEGRKKFDEKLKIGKFPYLYNGKALSEKEDGFVKVIVEPDHNQILGAVIVGAHATELISQLTIIKSLGLTVESIEDIIIPHPTISEALKESVLGAINMAIHA